MVIYFLATLQKIFQTVTLIPDPLPGVTVDITPICGKYVTIYV